MHLQQRLLQNVLDGRVAWRRFAQEPQQARRQRIVQLGERGILAVRVPLHGGVRGIKTWIGHRRPVTGSPLS